MRPIKFKAKSIEENSKGQWVEGNLILSNDIDGELFAQIEATYIEDFRKWEVDPKTVSEYTCILDSDGNEIFENEIIGVFDRMPSDELETVGYYEVFNGFRSGYPAFTLADSDELSDEVNTIAFLANGDFYFKVIGNVFDNPELLKSEPESNDA